MTGSCSICNRVSGSGDHLDCVEMRRIELDDAERRERLGEDLSVSQDPDNVDVSIKALLERMSDS